MQICTSPHRPEEEEEASVRLNQSGSVINCIELNVLRYISAFVKMKVNRGEFQMFGSFYERKVKILVENKYIYSPK